MMLRWGLGLREAEILSLVGQGKTGPEIAIILTISHDTVRKHMSSIFDKLGVETRTAAALITQEASPSQA
jgi:DNA-binding CsgD family transcriptional regulator